MKSKRPLGEHTLGTVIVPFGARLGVWDPCYGYGDMYDAESGEWEAQVRISDEHDWGHRVKWLSLARIQMGLDPREELTAAGVDSGQMGIYVINKTPIDTNERDYNKICDLTLGDMASGMLPYGVVSSTGFGDGCYAVWGRRNKNGLLTSIMVDFIPDEDEDDLDDFNTCDECGAEIDPVESMCGDCEYERREDEREDKD